MPSEIGRKTFVLHEGVATTVPEQAEKSDIAVVAKHAIEQSNLSLSDLKEIQSIFHKKYRKAYIPLLGKVEIPIFGSLANFIYITYHRKTREKLDQKIALETSFKETKNPAETLIKVLNYLPEFKAISMQEKENLSIFLTTRFDEKELKDIIGKAVEDRDFTEISKAISKAKNLLTYMPKLIENSAIAVTFSKEQKKTLETVRRMVSAGKLADAEKFVKGLGDKIEPRFQRQLDAEIKINNHRFTYHPSISKETKILNILGCPKANLDAFKDHALIKEVRHEFGDTPNITLLNKATSARTVLVQKDDSSFYTYVIKNGVLQPKDEKDGEALFFLIKNLIEAKDFAALQVVFRFEQMRGSLKENPALVKELLDSPVEDASTAVVHLRMHALLAAWGKPSPQEEIKNLLKIVDSENATIDFFLTLQEIDLLKISSHTEKLVLSGTIEQTKPKDLTPPEEMSASGTYEKEDVKNLQVQFNGALKSGKSQVQDEINRILYNCETALKAEEEQKKQPRAKAKPPIDVILATYNNEHLGIDATHIAAKEVLRVSQKKFEEEKAKLFGLLAQKMDSLPPLEALYYAYVQNDLSKVVPKGIAGKAKDAIQLVLNAHQDLQQVDRVINRCLITVNEKGEKVLVTEKNDKIKSALFEAATAKPAYDVKRDPYLQAFEVLQDMIIRPGQLEDTLKLLSGSIALQKLMGGGKTAVIIPVLALKKADGKILSTVLMPDNILSSEGGTIKAKLAGFFDKFIFECPDLGVGAKSDELEELYENLVAVQKSKGCVFTTPARTHALLNTFTFALEECTKDSKNQESIKALKASAKIIKLMFEDGSVLCDELDDVLKTRLQYIIGLGEPQAFGLNESKLIADLVKKVSTDFKDLELDFFKDVKTPKYLSQTYYDEKVLPSLAQWSIDALVKEHPKADLLSNDTILKTYLTARYRKTKGAAESEAWVKNLDPQLRNQIATLRQTLLHTLPTAFNSYYNKDYGLPKDTQNEDGSKKISSPLAIPYAGPDTPSNTQFSSPSELVVRTTMARIKEGEDVSTAVDSPFINILKNVKHSGDSISGTSQKLYLSFKNFSGITGTFWNLLTMPTFNKVWRDSITEGKSFLRLIEKSKPKEKVVNGKTETVPPDITVQRVDDTKSETLLKQIKEKNARSLIDTGGWLRDKSELAFAQEILDAMPDLQGVVFHNLEGKKQILKRDKQVYKFEGDTTDPSMRFTIYGKRFTVGTDILQATDALGILTMSKDMSLRDEAQGKYRLRQLLESQRLATLIDPETFAAMNDKIKFKDEKNPSYTPSFIETITFLLENQVDQVLVDNYQAANQRADALIELDLRKNIVSKILDDKNEHGVDEALKIYTDARRHFVSSKATGAWEQFGEIPENLDREKKVEKDTKRYIEQCTKLGLDQSTIDKLTKDCFGDISRFNVKLDSMVVPENEQVFVQNVEKKQANKENINLNIQVQENVQQRQTTVVQDKNEQLEKAKLVEKRAQFNKPINALKQLNIAQEEIKVIENALNKNDFDGAQGKINQLVDELRSEIQESTDVNQLENLLKEEAIGALGLKDVVKKKQTEVAKVAQENRVLEEAQQKLFKEMDHATVLVNQTQGTQELKNDAIALREAIKSAERLTTLTSIKEATQKIAKQTEALQKKGEALLDRRNFVNTIKRQIEENKIETTVVGFEELFAEYEENKAELVNLLNNGTKEQINEALTQLKETVEKHKAAQIRLESMKNILQPFSAFIDVTDEAFLKDCAEFALMSENAQQGADAVGAHYAQFIENLDDFNKINQSGFGALEQTKQKLQEMQAKLQMIEYAEILGIGGYPERHLENLGKEDATFEEDLKAEVMELVENADIQRLKEMLQTDQKEAINHFKLGAQIQSRLQLEESKLAAAQFLDSIPIELKSGVDGEIKQLQNALKKNNAEAIQQIQKTLQNKLTSHQSSLQRFNKLEQELKKASSPALQQLLLTEAQKMDKTSCSEQQCKQLLEVKERLEKQLASFNDLKNKGELLNQQLQDKIQKASVTINKESIPVQNMMKLGTATNLQQFEKQLLDELKSGHEEQASFEKKLQQFDKKIEQLEKAHQEEIKQQQVLKEAQTRLKEVENQARNLLNTSVKDLPVDVQHALKNNVDLLNNALTTAQQKKSAADIQTEMKNVSKQIEVLQKQMQTLVQHRNEFVSQIKSQVQGLKLQATNTELQDQINIHKSNVSQLENLLNSNKATEAEIKHALQNAKESLHTYNTANVQLQKQQQESIKKAQDELKKVETQAQNALNNISKDLPVDLQNAVKNSENLLKQAVNDAKLKKTATDLHTGAQNILKEISNLQKQIDAQLKLREEFISNISGQLNGLKVVDTRVDLEAKVDAHTKNMERLTQLLQNKSTSTEAEINHALQQVKETLNEYKTALELYKKQEVEKQKQLDLVKKYPWIAQFDGAIILDKIGYGQQQQADFEKLCKREQAKLEIESSRKGENKRKHEAAQAFVGVMARALIRGEKDPTYKVGINFFKNLSQEEQAVLMMYAQNQDAQEIQQLFDKLDKISR